jgi:hypothetical protein
MGTCGREFCEWTRLGGRDCVTADRSQGSNLDLPCQGALDNFFPMRRSYRLPLRLIKGGFLCVAIVLLGWYVQFMHRSANPVPTVTEAGALDLEMAPEVGEFEGFINYVPIEVGSTNAAGQPTTVILSSKNISQPIFKTRSVEVKPTILNGSKVFSGPVIDVPKFRAMPAPAPVAVP